jgi:hypothetical protein
MSRFKATQFRLYNLCGLFDQMASLYSDGSDFSNEKA